MSQEKKNFVPALVFVTLLSAIVCAISAYLAPHISLLWQISLGISVVGLITYLIADRAFFAETLSKKTAQYGLMSMVITILGVGVIIFVNLIASKYDIKKDLTKNKLHSLSAQSIKLVKGLEGEVRMLAFVRPQQLSAYEKIFDKYTYHSDKIKVEYVDVDKEYLKVKEYKIKEVGTIVVEGEARTARIENLTSPDDPKVEEKITNGIIRVAKGEKRKVYFLTGHKERPLSGQGGNSYSDVKTAMSESRYEVEELSLFEKKDVPSDAEILICAGPISNFFPNELDAVDRYIKAGGKFLLMIDPNAPEAVKPFLAKYYIGWQRNKTVFELNQLQQMGRGNPLVPAVSSYDPSHEITQGSEYPSIFPVPTPLTKLEGVPEGWKVTALFSTSPVSMQVAIKGNRIENMRSEKKGPLPLAFAVTGKAESLQKPAESSKDGAKTEANKEKEKADAEKAKEFRMVVVGDSDFVSNGAISVGMNSDLFQNMLAWLAHEEDLISIRPKPTDESKLEITTAKMKVITLASVFIAPLLMFFSGLAVWIRRRRA